MGRGNLYKAWVKLRHIITIAELIGLHNISQAANFGTAIEAPDQGYTSKVQLWGLICATDRLLGMVLSLPPITRHHRQTNSHSVSVGGIVQNQVYLSHLTDISKKIPDLDYFGISKRPRAEEYTLALELSKELQVLASQAPPAWWSGEVHSANSVNTSQIVQFVHYYAVMRVHLPLVLRQTPGEENLFIYLSCLDACESMVQLYQVLGRKLPPGLFLSEVLDIQAFSAAVALLLISHMCCVRFYGAGIDKAKINNEVRQVINLLHEKSNGDPGSGVAHNGFTALCSLNGLLSEAENDHDPRQVVLHVPLLGKLNVRCNQHRSEASNYWSSQLLSTLGLCNEGEEIPNQDFNFSLPMMPSFDVGEER